MIGTRTRKVLRDLSARPGRSLLAVLAMAAGLIEITAMLDAYARLRPELSTMHESTRPAAAILTTDACDDSVVDVVRAVPGVEVAEARPILMARARTASGDWVPAVLSVVRDFDRLTLDTFEREPGAPPPGPGDVLVERSAMEFSGARVSGPLTLRIPGREDVDVRVGGTVHAEGLAPAWMEHAIPAFIGWDSELRDPGGTESAQIRFRMSEHSHEEGAIREVAAAARRALEAHGHPVTRLRVPAPGRHPHADQMEAFLFLLLSFGILSLMLSAVLVAGMVQALLAEEMRTLGILQAVGARGRQIVALYLGHVAALAGLALAIGLPAGFAIGDGYARFCARILNADLGQRPFPVEVVALVVAIGLGVPMLVAAWPIRRAARVTVREALADAAGFEPRGLARVERILNRMGGLPRPLALGLRTMLLRRGRLVMSVGLLAIGGAAFLSALNVAEAWRRSVDDDFARRRYDLTVSLAHETPVADLDAVLASVPGVARVEHWPGAPVFLVGPDGVPGNPVALIGVEPGSRLLDLRVDRGRWLQAGDRDVAVVNRAVLRRNPALRIGDPVLLRSGERTLSFPVVGVVRELVPTPVVYAAKPAVLFALDRSADRSGIARIALTSHDADAERQAARRVEEALAAAGIEVAGIQRMEDARRGIQDHLVIILAVLGMSSGVVLVVGALGLASTLTLDVVRRTREIGVLGAIGARPVTIALLIWSESLVLALASWIVSLVLAAPLSAALEAAAGSIFLRTPLDFSMSPAATGIWLGVVVVIATLCSVHPAGRAARLPVREALAHV